MARRGTVRTCQGGNPKILHRVSRVRLGDQLYALCNRWMRSTCCFDDATLKNSLLITSTNCTPHRVAFSSFNGLLLILQLPDGLEPLLSTGNSKDIPSLYKRYLSTILHVKSWYDDDVFNPETKGYKSIRQVRAMHRRVQQIMNDKFDVGDVDGKKRLWMNQYDVAMTQFAFIGLSMLYPKKTAMIAASESELELINYYWRVLGWLMGLEDEYNLCQFDSYADIKEFNRLIFENEYKAKFVEQPCEKGLEMTKAICLALHYFLPLVSFNQLAHWWKDCFKFNGYDPQPMSARDRLLDFWTKLSFNTLLKNEKFLRFSTKLHQKRFDARLQRKDKVCEDLKEQYKECPYVFYSDRIDYFAKVDKVKDSVDNNGNISNDNSNVAADDNNNRDSNGLESAQANTKQVFTNVCPFGFETVLPSVAPVQTMPQDTTISA